MASTVFRRVDSKRSLRFSRRETLSGLPSVLAIFTCVSLRVPQFPQSHFLANQLCRPARDLRALGGAQFLHFVLQNDWHGYVLVFFVRDRCSSNLSSAFAMSRRRPTCLPRSGGTALRFGSNAKATRHTPSAASKGRSSARRGSSHKSDCLSETLHFNPTLYIRCQFIQMKSTHPHTPALLLRISCAVFLAGLPLSAHVSRDWAALATIPTLTVGAEIEVKTTDSKRYHGDFKSVDPEVLVMTTPSGEERLPNASVSRVSIKKIGHRGRNTLIGLGIGAAVGVIWGAIGDSNAGCKGFCISLSPWGKIIGATGGGLTGTIVGAVLPTGGWRTVYQAP
jgi:hypothetical protein